MKYLIISLLVTTCFVPFGQAQIIDPAGTVKRKATDRANGRIDQSIDQGFDKAEEGIGNLFRKKEKNKSAGDPRSLPAEKEKTTWQETENIRDAKAPFATYSKFDFLPGEKIIAIEDFSQDAIGDFPARWDTDGSGEVVSLSGKSGHWLRFSGEGSFYPEFVPVLSENTTIEFELGTDQAHQVLTMVRFVDVKSNARILNRRFANQVTVSLSPLGSTDVEVRASDESQVLQNHREIDLWKVPDKPFVRVSIWRQKHRLRVYMDQVKVWDIPRAFQAEADYRLVFETSTFFVENRQLLLSDLRVAEGLPDMRSKLLTEGKLVTTGILFDTGSEVIKPVSYGVLKEIAKTLNDTPTLNVRITGHTDNQGNAQSNLTLSTRRAEAVKEALIKTWGISASRLQTEGKGQTVPVADNQSSEGRANNRRVEFTKL